MAKIKVKDLKEGGRSDGRPSGLVQQGYLHPKRTGDGLKEMETFCEICHGHQRAFPFPGFAIPRIRYSQSKG